MKKICDKESDYIFAFFEEWLWSIIYRYWAEVFRRQIWLKQDCLWQKM